MKALNFVFIEDSEDLCRTWEDILTLDGHKVSWFLSARDALNQRQILSNANILVTDFYLPDINGLNVIQEVRKITPKLPVILLTGSREDSIRHTVKKFDRTVLLYKPLNIEDLERAAKSLIQIAD